MKLAALSATATALAVTLAHAPAARADDPGMQLVQVMMATPALSADGQHVAIYSSAPSDDRATRTSLAIFSIKGALERRVGVVPPAVDAKRATADAAAIVKVLGDGRYQRMARVASHGGRQGEHGAYAIDLKSEDVELALAIAGRKVSITGTRAGKAIAPIAFALPVSDGACPKEVTFSVANTTAGYDKASHVLAVSVQVFAHDTSCFAHDYVLGIP